MAGEVFILLMAWFVAMGCFAAAAGVAAWFLCGEAAKYLRRHPEVVKAILEHLCGPPEATKAQEVKRVKTFLV